MSRTWLSRWLKKKVRPIRRQSFHGRFLPEVEALGERVLPSVTALFSPGAHLLTVFGDAANNTITISRDAAGKILVNGGSVRIQGGTPTVANTSLVDVFGQAGDDTITMDETNGALPAAFLFG